MSTPEGMTSDHTNPLYQQIDKMKEIESRLRGAEEVLPSPAVLVPHERLAPDAEVYGTVGCDPNASANLDCQELKEGDYYDIVKTSCSLWKDGLVSLRYRGSLPGRDGHDAMRGACFDEKDAQTKDALKKYGIDIMRESEWQRRVPSIVDSLVPSLPHALDGTEDRLAELARTPMLHRAVRAVKGLDARSIVGSYLGELGNRNGWSGARIVHGLFGEKALQAGVALALLAIAALYRGTAVDSGAARYGARLLAPPAAAERTPSPSLAALVPRPAAPFLDRAVRLVREISDDFFLAMYRKELAKPEPNPAKDVQRVFGASVLGAVALALVALAALHASEWQSLPEPCDKEQTVSVGERVRIPWDVLKEESRMAIGGEERSIDAKVNVIYHNLDPVLYELGIDNDGPELNLERKEFCAL